ncbi:MAG: hypothetical protein KIS66_01505 [Fimbriimonadaceae bacterium]|nr:hypothetical protein [Fimbriimonadaceae bacterium]
MENDEAQPGRAGDPGRVDAEALRQEVERLRRELREARGEVPDASPAPEPSLPVQAPAETERESSPTPDQQERAEALLREARVAEMRNQADRAEALVREAAAVAPGSSEVLEALADRLAATRKTIEAKQTYQRAVKANPHNVSAERKLAELVLRETEAELMASGYMAMTSEAVASSSSAFRFSLVLPGFGQVLLGETAKGLGLIAGWVVCWAIALQTSKAALGPASNLLDKALFGAPILVALTIYGYGLADLAGRGDPTRKPRRPDRPKPPVDLEF